MATVNMIIAVIRQKTKLDEHFNIIATVIIHTRVHALTSVSVQSVCFRCHVACTLLSCACRPKPRLDVL